MLKKITKSIIHRVGYDIVQKRKQDLYEPEFDEILSVIRENTMVVDSGLHSLYQQALFCETHDIVGDFVECGVWKGGAVGLMALVNLRHHGSRRHIHLFDSFDEICEPDEAYDGERAINEVKMWTKNGGTKGNLVPLEGFYDNFGGPGTIQENEELLVDRIGYDPQYIHFHKGWFQQTIPEQHRDIDKIAILRIDADWYASTKVCLEHLFDKVVKGGFVIIDDYGAYAGCRKAVDEFIESTGQPLFLNHVESEIRYIIPV